MNDFAIVADCAGCGGQMIEETCMETLEERRAHLRCQDCGSEGELRHDFEDGLEGGSWSGLTDPEIKEVSWIDCQNCRGSGEVVGCIDDICHGKGRCIHNGNDACPACGGSGRQARIVETDGGRDFVQSPRIETQVSCGLCGAEWWESIDTGSDHYEIECPGCGETWTTDTEGK